jgi:DinB family protein
MPETAEQYIERILGYLGTRDPLHVLRSTAGEIAALIRSRNDEDLHWTPSPARWSAAAIVAHLADAEVVASYRIRMIAASPGVAIQAFDQNAWASAFEYQHQDAAAALGVFRPLRDAWLALIERGGESWLDRYGVHAERGKETISHLLRLYAGHDLNHLQQISRILDERDGTTL